MSLRPSSSSSHSRVNGYKKGVTAEGGRKKREGELLLIRKIKKHECLLKKRCCNDSGSTLLSTLRLLPPKLENLPLMVEGVCSKDAVLQLEAMTQFRKLLSDFETHDEVQRPPIHEVIGAGVVPRFVEFLELHHFPQLQLEAAWALTNIASGDLKHTQLVIELNAIPRFVQLLCSSDANVREQAVWALGNIAGNSPRCRDLVLSHGALRLLICQLDGVPEVSMVRITAWALSNLCRGKPPPRIDQVEFLFLALRRLIDSEDEEILASACWALSFLSDDNSQNVQYVIGTGACPRLLELLMHPSPVVLVPTLQSLGNIVAGDDDHTQFVIDSQVLPYLYRILTSNHGKRVKRDTCWVISNFTAGHTSQIQAVIEANIIPPLLDLLQHAEFDVKKEAALAISNAVSQCDQKQMQYLVNVGCIKPLCDLLTCSDPGVVTICLDGIESILESTEENSEFGNYLINVYLQLIHECEGLHKIEGLQNHKNVDVYEKAVKILDKYFHREDDEEVTDAYHGVPSFKRLSLS
ncbi:hypothetical protein MLD38_036004 [Melastoma candidum]|uniref:Uncharacterized protein n=1 Tax=Melastoma candidum TaxID=119954 RepID=A0ACB9LIA3_9MYRT|nr:hypothetical protein MLD38_036004 [Melastoma candidum]